MYVGNIGCVYRGHNGFEARKAFNIYRSQSKKGYGRAAGEDVGMLRDGEPHDSYWGSLSRQED